MKSVAGTNPFLCGFWREPGIIKILKGGRASSKTWDVSAVLVFSACKSRLKFLCLRQLQSKIADSVYTIICDQIDRFGVASEFYITNNSIVHKKTGSSFHFYGIQRNIRDIKGFEGTDVCWIEEAEDLNVEQWEIINPTVRKQGALIIMTYNPHLESDYIESSPLFKPRAGVVVVRHINYDENPFISKTMIEKINRLKDADFSEFQHIYLGVPKINDNAVIIKRAWIMAAVDAHIKLGFSPEGKSRLGFDVADSGSDKCSIVLAHGSVAIYRDSWKGKEDELLKSCGKAYGVALQNNSEIYYDAIGVGAHCGSKFDEMNRSRRSEDYFSVQIKYTKFVAGGSVIRPDRNYISAGSERTKNKDFFADSKSQAWWNVADRFRNTYSAVVSGEQFPVDQMISISSDVSGLENLINELSSPRSDFDNNCRVKVESKKSMAKRGYPSPNDADAFIMAFCPSVRRGSTYD